ncbi:hypothetical protein PGB90_000028 [Kerria lacca]
MLYFEDYLELIEHLPQETVDRLTDMRELDLQVQNSLDNIEKRTVRFFQNAYHLQSSELETEHNNIMKEYKKIIEDSEEKVQLANCMTDSMGKYMRRLDQDILKFKMELEADNCGITEIIEKRLEEPDEDLPITTNISSANRGTRRQSYQTHNENASKSLLSSDLKRHDVMNTVEQKFQRLSLPTSNPIHSQVMFNVEQMGAGGCAIAAAASQAIAATQQMQQGRRSASLKASLEAINSGTANFGRTTDISTINRELRRTQIDSSAAESSALMDSVSSAQETADDSAMEADPDEPRYCICNQVAFGGMVACDNKKCPYEWYHYPCVGITDPPKGKWYCPQCSATMKRRNRKSM